MILVLCELFATALRDKNDVELLWEVPASYFKLDLHS
jgi:hypothetical protein